MLLHQAIERLCQLDGVQVLALHVLDQRELERVGRRHVLHHHERLAQPRLLTGAPAPLARDDLELVDARRRAPHHDRLEEAVLADRSGELVDRVGVEVLPRLPLLRNDLLERTRKDALVAVAPRARRDGQERVEPTTERALLRIDHRAAHTA